MLKLTFGGINLFFTFNGYPIFHTMRTRRRMVLDPVPLVTALIAPG